MGRFLCRIGIHRWVHRDRVDLVYDGDSVVRVEHVFTKCGREDCPRYSRETEVAVERLSREVLV